MSDEQVTPDIGNSAEQNAQENWEQRAKEQQAGFTKSQQELAAERAIWDDEQAAWQKFSEKFPHLITDDEEETEEAYEPDEEDRPLTKAEFEEYKREQAQVAQQQTAQQQFETDFKAFVNDRELSPQGERAIRSTPGIKGPDDLKKAVDEVFAHEDSLKGKPRPRVPHVPANGQAATGVPDFSGMSRVEIDKYMAERAAGQLQAS